MAELNIGVLVVLALAVLAGTIVQSVVGIGLGLVGAPIMALVAPELMPGTMLILALALPFATLARDHGEIDWRGIGWSMPGRIVGIVVGTWIVVRVSERELGLAIGIAVLLAVALTLRTIVIPLNPRTLVGAGFAAGVMGTTSSIGGPPMALVYQHGSPRQMRSTMAVFFATGVTLSLMGLAFAGEVTAAQLVVAAMLLPAVAVGFFVSGPLAKRLSPTALRPLVLTVSAVSALVLIVRSGWPG